MDIVTYALLNGKIKDYANNVDEWLKKNVDPATGYVLDRSLQMENAAAPADMVGDINDEVGDLKNTLNHMEDGVNENMTAGNAMQLDSSVYAEDQVPYLFRQTGGGVNAGTREVDTIVGGTVVWNQLVNSGMASVTVPNGHKYLSRIDSVVSIGTSTGTEISINDATQDNIFDLTQMFGTAIADRALALEQATAGSGIAWLKSMGFFTQDYYPYDAGTLKSVEGLQSHNMRDANDTVIASYPLDSDLTLRGIPKLDTNNKLYYDGDTYEADGSVTRRYGIYTITGNESFDTTGAGQHIINVPSLSSLGAKIPTNNGEVSNAITIFAPTKSYASLNVSGTTDGIGFGTNGFIIIGSAQYDVWSNLVGQKIIYELATPTTETADPFQTPQICDPSGTEEYVTTGIVPIGHLTKYPEDLRAKIEGLPWDLSMIAPIENGTTASQAYTTGQYFLHNDLFCKALTSIASGATFTLNTNYAVTTVAAELYAAINS